jgi:hypothetical protein
VISENTRVADIYFGEFIRIFNHLYSRYIVAKLKKGKGRSGCGLLKGSSRIGCLRISRAVAVKICEDVISWPKIELLPLV